MLTDPSLPHEPQPEHPGGGNPLKPKQKFHAVYLVGSALILIILCILTILVNGYLFFIPFILPYVLLYATGLLSLYKRWCHAYGLFLIQAWLTIVFGIAGFTLLLVGLLFMLLMGGTLADLVIVGLYCALFIFPLPVLNACAIQYYSARKHWFKPAVTKG